MTGALVPLQQMALITTFMERGGAAKIPFGLVKPPFILAVSGGKSILFSSFFLIHTK